MREEMETYLEKAAVLVEALPYIQRFNRKIIVVKYGGSAMVDEELKKSVISDVTLLKLVGFKPIIVHGGGKEISKWVSKVGKEAEFVNGLRVTDAETMEIAEMVLNRVNKGLVQMIQQLGTVTLEADTFDMVELVVAGRIGQAQQKLKTLLELQNDPILITGALAGNYLDLYRVLQARRSRRSLAELAKDFGYGGKWNYRLGKTEKTAARFKRHQLEQCLCILQKLDLDLKSSRLEAELLLQKALCELALAGRSTC